MEFLFYAIAVIIGLFFILLILKNILKWKRFCTLCVAVSLTWIILLVFYYYNIFTDKLIIAILMGHTSLGIFYFLEKKLKKEFLFFRLPYLLTSIILIYFVLSDFIVGIIGLYIVFGAWFFFLFVYLFKKNQVFSKFVKKIIECCGNW